MNDWAKPGRRATARSAKSERSVKRGIISSLRLRFAMALLIGFGVTVGLGALPAAAQATPGSEESDGVAREPASGVEALADGEVEDPGEEESGQDDEDFSGIETMEITGQAGQAVAVDTAESVTSFGAEDLAALGVSDISDISQVTPNLEIRVSGATNANFFIRGVGLADFSANAASAVAIYQDGVALNSPAIQLGQIFDTESIEVLRGPQGAGSGRNASAGAIKIYSRKPTGSFSAEMRTTTGRYESDDARNSLIQSYEGAVEMPLVEDVLSTRIAFRVQANDPYQYNGCGGLPPLVVPPETNQLFIQPAFGPPIPIPPQNNHLRFEEGLFSPGDNPDRPYFRGALAPTLRSSGLSLCGRLLDDMTVPKWEYNPGTAPNTGILTENKAITTGGSLEPKARYDGTPGDLPSAVGDKGNWSVRGQLRYQPMDSQVDMDWNLNLHGGRLDQYSTLGQAIGTNQAVVGAPDSSPLGFEKIAPTGYGGSVGSERYQEPDTAEELVTLYEAFKAAKLAEGLPEAQAIPEAKADAFEALQANLARNRPLDIRPYRGDYNRIGKTKLDSWGASLNGVLYFDSMELHSVTGYEGYTRYRETDQDFTSLELFEAIIDDQAWQFSQEIQASGENESGAFTWTAGGYFLTEDLTFGNQQFIVNAILSDGLPLEIIWRRGFEQKTKAFAANAGFTWEFIEGLTLDAGIRYNWEEKEFDLTIDRSGSTGSKSSTTQWSEPTGSVILTYLLDDTRAVYWKFGHGFKAGHYNSIDIRDADKPAKPESLNSLEAGFRGIFMDGRLSMDGAIFFYQYENYQVFLFDDQANRPPSLAIKNAAETEQYGAEFNFTATPLVDLVADEWSGLSVTGRFSWLRSRFLNFTNQRTGNYNGQLYSETVDYSGNSLPNSPNFKVSATVDWAFDLDGLGTIIPRYDLAWTDDLFFDPSNGVGVNQSGPLPKLALGQPAYALHNLRLSYLNPEGTAEVSLWVRNLTDVRYRDYAFDATTFSSLILNFVGEPRSMGIDFSLRF